MSVEMEYFYSIASTVKEHTKVLESQASDIKNLDEWLHLQHYLINSVEEQCDFLAKQMQRTYKHIFWYVLAIIFSNIALLIMLGILILR